MSSLNHVAHFQNRRDEAPNQELARQLAEEKDRKGIREIAANLWNQNPGIQSDCLKVLYEIGYLDPRLIADYADDFLKLLKSRNNRLVWGSLIALSTMAELKAEALEAHAEAIRQAMKGGSVITNDNAVKTLALIAASSDKRRAKLFPSLLKHLAACRPKDVPQRAEKIAVAVSAANKRAFVEALEKRLTDLSGSQAARVKRVIREAEKR